MKSNVGACEGGSLTADRRCRELRQDLWFTSVNVPPVSYLYSTFSLTFSPFPSLNLLFLSLSHSYDSLPPFLSPTFSLFWLALVHPLFFSHFFVLSFSCKAEKALAEIAGPGVCACACVCVCVCVSAADTKPCVGAQTAHTKLSSNPRGTTVAQVHRLFIF